MHGTLRLPEQDLMFLDIDWLVRQYPRHRAYSKRVRKLFSKPSFASEADWLGMQPLKPAHIMVGALALTESQQRELYWLMCKPAKTKRAEIEQSTEEAEENLRVAHNSRPRARIQPGRDQTIQRRFDVWRCGSLAEWMPTETARFYRALTGEPMTRAIADKVIKEVWRDYPESEPSKERRRRSSTITKSKAATKKVRRRPTRPRI